MKRITIICLWTALILLGSCDGMDATYKEFKGETPVIYTEKVEGVVAYPGNCRIKLVWDEMIDSRIKGATVYWNNRTGHQDFNIDPHQRTEIIVEDMPEGSVIVEIVTWDDKGHRSVPQTISTTTYGDKFVSAIADKSTVVSAARGSSNEVFVRFYHNSSRYYQYMELEYLDQTGNKKTLQIKPGTESMFLQDCAGDELTYRSVFLPEADCIDLLRSEDVKILEIPAPAITVADEEPTLYYARGCKGSTRVTSTWPDLAAAVADDAKEWLSATLSDNILSYSAIARNPSSTAREGRIVLSSGAFSKEVVIIQQGQNEKLGTAYGKEGIIFWQNPDNPKEYKIISAKGWSPMKWSTANSTTGATSYTGVTGTKKNIDLIRAMADYGKTNTYAMQTIEALGEGWYMPSLNEMKDEFWTTFNGTIFEASTSGSYNAATADEKACRDKFEAAMAAIGGQKINMTAPNTVGSSILTCTESNNSTCVSFRVGKPFITTVSKTAASHYARGVKVVVIED